MAVVAALNVATGAPMDTMPDRPPIMVPTLAPFPTMLSGAGSPAEGPAKTTALTGTVTNIQDGFVFVNGVPVRLVPATQVNGQLRAGQEVQIQAKLRADGVLEADELDLSEKSDAPPAAAQPTEQTRMTGAVEPVTTPTLVQGAKPSSPELKPTEEVKPGATEKPEVKPTDKPEAHPTEKVQVEPTAKPEARPTARPSGDDGKPAQNGTQGQTEHKDPGKNGDSGSNKDSGKDSADNHSQGD